MSPRVPYHAGLLLVILTAPIATPPAGAAEWSSYANAPGGGRYVSANQISRDNVASLEVAWTFHSGDVSDGSGDRSPTSFQATPIYFDGRVIFCTPFNRVVALDPATGRPSWTFDSGLNLNKDAGFRRSDRSPLRCRGVTGWTDPGATGLCAKTVFLGSIDARIFALDAATGKPCPEFNDGKPIDLNALPPSGEGQRNISSPPAVIDGKVVFGLSIGDNTYADMQDGVVRAFDARTGLLAWSFNPIPEPLRRQTGAANVWAPISASETLGKVFLPTTSPSPDYFGGLRAEPMPHTDAVVALSAATGEPDWSFQITRHNLWDYDLASQPTVIETGAGSVDGPVIAQATKQGFVFLLDAATGLPAFPIKELPVPPSTVEGEKSSPIQIVPELPGPVARTEIDPDAAFGLTVVDTWLCRQILNGLEYGGLFTPPSTRGILNVPSFAGGVNWGGVSADPERRILVVNSMNTAAEVRIIPADEYESVAAGSPGYETTMMRGTPYAMQRRILLSPLKVPCSPPPWGEVMAIDLKTGRTLWRHPHGQVRFSIFTTPEEWGSPGMGGTMVTAGGLVFLGASMDRTFRAYDIETGDTLWSREVPSSAMASPMSFEHDGRQYVIVAAGGHGALGEFGDALVAFALPD